MDAIPIMRVTVKADCGVWRLTFDCPWCRKRHAHGGGSTRKAPIYGHRLTHCPSHISPPSYLLVPARPYVFEPRKDGPDDD